MQGEARASAEPGVVLTTVLGSCVAACLHDPDAHVGGLNHFLLPAPSGDASDPDDLHRYGLYSMELLVNALLKQGAQRARLKAWLVGGANMHAGLRPIGTENAEFAKRFLENEGIELVGDDTGGRHARRVEFRPAEGLIRSRQVSVSPVEEQPRIPPAVGAVELF